MKDCMDRYPYRLGLQQRVLPAYRAPFFDALASACARGLDVFAGEPRPSEAIEPARALQVAHHTPAHNRHILGGSLYLCWQDGLLDWLSTWDPQALILEANPRYLSNPRAVRWMHARHRPVIGWGLGSPALTGPLAGWRRSLRLRSLRQYDALITYSQRGAAEYRSCGFPAERVFVAPNAAVPRPIQPPAPRPSAFSGAPVVLFVGRLQARKRVDTLLHACAALSPALHPRLLVIGDGPARPGLEALSAEIYPRAEFSGARHGPDLEPYFAAADLFVLPGTGGLAVQQALAHGLPVIVGEADGTQADLVREENGWQVPPGDLPALTKALQDALASAPRLRQMGAASYRIATDEINLETMVAAFLKALEAVFGKCHA